MKNNLRRMGRISGPALLLMLVAQGCAAQAPTGPAAQSEIPRLRGELQQLQGQLDAAIGSASCSDNNQCASLALGAKPCGGPRRYLVYSKTFSDESELRELATRYHQIDVRLNRLTGAMSDCMMVTPPPVACRQGRCMIDR